MFIVLLFFLNFLSAEEWNFIDLVKGEWRESVTDLNAGELELKRDFYSAPHDLNTFAKDWHFNLPDFGKIEEPRQKWIPPENKQYFYQYDNKKRLISCELVQGSEVEAWFKITYDTNTCTVHSHLGESIIYGLMGPHLAYVEKSNGKRCTYTYLPHPLERQCLLVERREPGSWTKISYNEKGKIQAVYYSKDEGETFTRTCLLEYQPHLTTVTDAKDVVYKYYFNSLSQVEKIETFLPDGQLYYTQELEWEGAFLIRKTIWEAHHQLLLQQRMVFDERGNLIDEFLEGTLTELGKTLESAHKKYTYDHQNRLIQEEMEGLLISYAYDEDKKKPSLKWVREEGVLVETTHYTYNAADCLIQTRVDDGTHQIILEEQEAPHQVTEKETPSPFNLTKDCLGRIATETTLPVLDCNDQLVQWTTTYLYDPLDRIIEIISPDNKHKKTVYNARGQPLAIYYSDGTFEEKQYTLGGRLKKEIFRDQTSAHYTWDGLGRLKRKAFYCSQGDLIKSTECFYVGRDLVKEIFSSGIIIEHIYDEAGRKIDSFNNLGRRVSYDYEDTGKLSNQKEWLNEDTFILRTLEPPKTPEKNIRTEWIFNDRGETVMQMTNVLDGTLLLYDALNRIEKITSNSCVRHLRHDFYGRKVKETYVYSDRTIINRWVYDEEGHLLVLVEDEGSSKERKTFYTYTPFGKLESQIEANGVKLSYSYDSARRLSHLYSSDGTIDYALFYNAQGQIQTVIDRLTGLRSEREYDLEGQLIKEKLANGLSLENSYDLIGRRKSLKLPDGSIVNYHFDKENLHSIVYEGLEWKEQSIEPSEETITQPDLLEYDLAANLIKKVSHGNTYLFSYDALHRLTCVKKNGEEVHRYTYDLFHRRLIDRDSLFIYDGNWEMGKTNLEGSLQELRIFEPSRTAEQGRFMVVKGDRNPWTFAGKRQDPLTGLIHFGRRDFDPEIGKFITPDPLGLIDGSDRDTYLPRDYFGLKTMSEWWEDFKQSTIAFFDGLKDKILNSFQIIKESHSIKISQVFKHMVGPGFLLLQGHQPTQKCSGIYGKGELNDKVRVSFTNGILTDKGSLANTLKALSESHGNVNIHYVYRPTKGWVYDILHSFAVSAGLVSEQAEMLAKEWKQMIYEMGGEGKIIHYAHSIGAIESERALSLLTEEEQKLIHIYAFGSPNLAETHPYQQTYHFVSIHDGVCLLNLIGYIKACTGSINNVVFAGSLLSTPFVDHLFGNQTYQDIWKSMGRTFTEWYGTL